MNWWFKKKCLYLQYGIKIETMENEQERNKRLKELTEERLALAERKKVIKEELIGLDVIAAVNRKETERITQLDNENRPKYSISNSGHPDSLSEGEYFQNYVARKFYERVKISIVYYTTQDDQRQIGESVQGIEVKLDNRCTGDDGTKPTFQLGIEIGEKTNIHSEMFTPSGIYAKGNTWLYVVGNYMMFWAFSKTELIRLHKSGKYKQFLGVPTMDAFFLPIEDADEYCLFKVTGN